VPPFLYSTGNRSYSLTVGGVNVITSVPLDEAPIRWTESGPGVTGSLSFLVMGSLGSQLQDGAVVRLKDNVNNRTLFGGLVLRRTLRPGPGSLRWTEVECASHDWWLDHKLVPRWESKRNVGGRVRRMQSDRAMVKDLIERRGGRLEARGTYVDETNSDMDGLIQIEGETLRGALEIIADEAQETESPGTRLFYVDGDWDLHWFNAEEGLTAPYRIADGSYVRTVITTTGLVEYWSLREEGGSTFYGSLGVTNLDRDSQIAVQYDVGAVNDLAYRASTFDGTNTGAAASSVAGLKVGDSWSFECWLRRTESAGEDYLLLTFASGAENGPQITLEADGDVKVVARTVGTDFVTTGQPITDNAWHHLVVAHGVGSTVVYVNGASVSGTLTARVFGDTWDTFTVARVPDGFIGDLQHVAWYTTQLSAATVLAHYRQGISIAPEDLSFEIDGEETAHFAYVTGDTKAGSGWVRPDNAPDWDSGNAEIYVDAPRAKTEAQKRRKGKAELNRHRRVRGGRFSVLGLGGWRSGQALPVSVSSVGLDETFAIASVNGELGAGSVPVYEVEFGAVRKSFLREIRRKRRQRNR
jgi:hypothetical protein